MSNSVNAQKCLADMIILDSARHFFTSRSIRAVFELFTEEDRTIELQIFIFAAVLTVTKFMRKTGNVPLGWKMVMISATRDRQDDRLIWLQGISALELAKRIKRKP